MFSIPLIVLTLGLGLSYYVYSLLHLFFARARFSKLHGCLPVKLLPQAERLLGLDVAWQLWTTKAQSRWMMAAHHNNGPTWSVTIMGHAMVMTCDPENIKAILATNFDDFGLSHRERIFSPLLGSGIFDTDGEAWQHSRALVRPAFTKSQVADLNLFEPHALDLMERIPRDGSTIDLAPLFFQLTADVTFEFLFGDSNVSMTNEEKQRRLQVCAAFDYAKTKLGKYGNYGWQHRLCTFTKFAKSCRLVHEYVDEYVQKGLARAETQDSIEKTSEVAGDVHERNLISYVFLDELVKSTRDPLQIRNELLNILLAGRDTTASLLTEAFHVLARNPEVWKKLKREIDGLKGALPSYTTLRDMKYLRHFLTECLRLYAVVPYNSRTANKDTTIPFGGGLDGKSPVFIPKGKRVGYSVWVMHRDPAIYGADAEEFRPERWDEMRPGWHYLPFNGGPRICPGQQFALTEASYIIVRFLQVFNKIENRDPNPWEEDVALTMTSKHGAKVALYK